MMKTLFTTWISTLSGGIGIGVVEDDFGKLSIKASPILGQNVKYDENLIAEWGGTVVLKDLKSMINMIESDQK